MTGGRRVKRAVLARALAIQGSWNYETLLGTGFGFAILPALRQLYPDPRELDEAVRRHEDFFNSHPYLAPLALGAVIRLEEDREDPAVIGRFKAALRGALGTLGDQLVWVGWRPVCVLVALSLLLAGAPWYVAVVAFLVLYNVGHLLLMTWGLSVGLREGRHVAERLRSSLVRQTHSRLMPVGAFISAFAATLVVLVGVPGLGAPAWSWVVAGAAAVVIGAGWGDRARRVAELAVVIAVVAGLVAGVAS
jgi:mannose PTS system EIID component